MKIDKIEDKIVNNICEYEVFQLNANINKKHISELISKYDMFKFVKLIDINDGYDILEVMNDIKDLPVTVVYDTAFFFGKHYSEFMRIFQRYSIKDIERTNLPKEVKKKLIKVVKDSVNLVLYPLSSNFAK